MISLRHSESATSEFFPLLTATLVFMATFGALTLVSVQVTNRAIDAGDQGGTEVSASRLADAIFADPGSGWYSTLDCSSGEPDPDYLSPEDVSRFGLGTESCPQETPDATIELDLEKVRNLAQAETVADPTNDHVDYDEAILSLDLGIRDFHLRSWPLLPDLEETLESGDADPNLRVAYVGDYDILVNGVPTSFVVNKACGKTELADRVDVWVDIQNNGSAATAFGVAFTVPLSQHSIEIRKHTALVASLGTVRVTASLPKTSDWEWAGTPEVTIGVSDSVRSLGDCTVSLSGITMTSVTTTPIYSTYAEHLENILPGGSTVKVYYDAFTGKGAKTTTSGWKLAIQTSLGLPLSTDNNLNPRGWESFTIVAPGNHNVKLQDSLGLTTLSQSVLNMVSTALSPFTPLGAGTISYFPGDSAEPEAAFIDALVAGFDARVHNALYDSLDIDFDLSGDIFPDFFDSIATEFAPRLVDGKGTLDPTDDVATLANYSAIVVGSAADHTELNSITFKNALAAWVDAGGLLIVYGSDAQTEQWLEPIFFGALETAGGGLSTPDPTHALLRSPNALDHVSYDAGGIAWTFARDEDAAFFTSIIAAGSGSALALSEPGAMGNGTVLLTSFRPWDLQGAGSTGSCDPEGLDATCEALKFVHNQFTIAYRELFIDYGPELPSDQRVSSVTRMGIVYHDLLDERIQLLLQVYVF